MKLIKDNLVPLENWMIVEEILDYKEEDAGGKKLALPDSYVKKQKAEKDAAPTPSPYKVLAIGPGLFIDGKLIPPSIKVGDIVIIGSAVITTEYKHEEMQIARADGAMFIDNNSVIPGVKIG